MALNAVTPGNFVDELTDAAQSAKAVPMSNTGQAASFTETGVDVHYSGTATGIGSDGATVQNFNLATDASNGHNVVIHGTLPNHPNAGFVDRPTVDANPMNPNQVADIIQNNPDYTPVTCINLILCNSAVNGSAQELSDIMGVPVTAPTGPAGIQPSTGNIAVRPLDDQTNPFITFTPSGN